MQFSVFTVTTETVQIFDAIVISSLFAPSFYKMDMFTSRERTMTKDGNGIAVNGIIGYFLDIPVVLSDRLYDTTNTEDFYPCNEEERYLLHSKKENPFAETAKGCISDRQQFTYLSFTLWLLLMIQQSLLLRRYYLQVNKIHIKRNQKKVKFHWE